MNIKFKLGDKVDYGGNDYRITGIYFKLENDSLNENLPKIVYALFSFYRASVVAFETDITLLSP